jgi:PAS domain S-box-containing protein
MAVPPQAADGSLAQLIRTHDWAVTPLGPVADWPPSLLTAVDICVTSRIPTALCWGQQEKRLIYNDAYAPILGSKHPASLGEPARLVWPEIWPTVGPLIEGVFRGESFFFEDRQMTVQRAGYPEEVYFTFSFSPITVPDGGIGGAFCSVTETTARVLAERRRVTLHRLGTIPVAEASTDEEACRAAMAVMADNPADVPFAMIYLLGPDGEHPRLAGPGAFPADAPLTAQAADTLLRPTIEEVISTQAPRMVTGLSLPPRWPGPAGEAAPDAVLVLPLTVAGNGHPTGVLCCAVSPYRALDDDYRAFFDLVARQLGTLVADARSWEAERIRSERLAELDRAKTVFFSNISHEFRTPLTLIMGPLEELRAAWPAGADSAVLENLEVIHRNGLRLGKLVSTLLDFSQIEAGRMQASYEPVDLALVTAELAGVFRSAIEKAGLTFEVDCQPLGEPVYLDRDMWEKVVLNLLSNALKFTFDGAIRVSLHREPGYAVVEVADTGSGIPEQELPCLFERFHRVHGTRSRSSEGSGIGLALVQELAGLHGGTIAADSKVGDGTVFTVRLPLGHKHLPPERLAPERLAPERPVQGQEARGPVVDAAPYVQEALRWSPDAYSSLPPAAQDQADGSRDRVLIVDDNADMREYLCRLLGSAYRVCAAADGKSALKAAVAEHPDLIISDVMMPEIDGIALIRALRHNRATATIPVLLLSARAGHEATVEGLGVGAVDYLAKPFSAQELLARVRSALEPARLRLRESRIWRALVESLDEGFFVCDERGLFSDVNDAFGQITGYGPEGLPYQPPYPWQPDAVTEPELRRLFGISVGQSLRAGSGRYTYPIRHRDGRLVWAATTVQAIPGRDDQGRVFVGTIRDVTAEHEAAGREAAVARLAAGLAGAADVAEVLNAGLAELHRTFGARRAVAAIWPRHGPVSVAGVPAAAAWPALDEVARKGLETARRHPVAYAAADGPACVGAWMEAGDAGAAVWLDRGTRSPLGSADRVLFGLLSAQLGHALTRAMHYEQTRDVALALQQSILGPLAVPAGFAVRYEPAMRPLEVGGDWHDVTPLGDGRIGVVVGDCVGRGLDAAAVMGQLRSACRALLLQARGPAQVVTDLDNFADRIPGATCTTVFCAIIDPAAATIRYSSAGHLPAVLVHCDGAAPELLDRATAVPLAVLASEARSEATALLRPGSALLLYTDGLIERRGERLDVSIGKATELVQRHLDGTPDELADRIMAAMRPAGGFDDDVAVLTYRQPPGPLQLDLAAEPTLLAGMRRRLRDWLAASAVPADTAGQVVLAASEACSNVIEHAYGGDPARQMMITALISGSCLELTVADSGQWKRSLPDRGDRGHGLRIMRTFMDEIVIEPGRSGTVVRMSREVGR